jgi:hypothetical protein
VNTLRLEIGEGAEGEPCVCCGVASITAHGFLYRNGDAHAIYYAGWSVRHPEHGVTMAIAVGRWEEGSSAADRVSIGVRATSTATTIDFIALNSADSPWSNTPLLGKMLERDQAVTHPAWREVLEVAEYVVQNDARIRDFWGATFHGHHARSRIPTPPS